MFASPATVERPRADVSSPVKAGFRSDIEGLRALAVTLVVLFHAGVTAVPGGFVGVDVFFVISGFLITGLLIDEVRRTGTVSLSNFYARRARRLLPLATLVLIATGAVGVLLLAPLELGPLASDIRASALFVSNWNFAASATDYWASDAAESPLLHFWSLSVEEQFYFVWPLLVLGIASRSARRSPWKQTARRLAIGLGVIGIGSFALSALTTATGGPWAYFGTHNRAWELAVGGGLALARPLLPLIPRTIALLLGWAGLVAVVSAALLYSSATVYPGTAAALPVLGTAALLAAGAGSQSAGVPRIFSERPVRYVGRISYAWYLWHWPCLVFVAYLPWVSESGPTGLQVTGAVVVSFALSAASHRWVEEPVRRSSALAASKSRSLAMGAGLIALALVVSFAVAAAPQDTSRTYGASGSLVDAQTAKLIDTTGTAAMTASAARQDRGGGTLGCHVEHAATGPAGECVFGDVDSKDAIALVGDSHALHWFPAMRRYAEESDVRLYLFTKSQCPFADVQFHTDGFDGLYTACTEWQENVADRLESLDGLDTVVLGRSARYTELLSDDDGKIHPPTKTAEVWREGTERALDRLEDVAPRVVILQDTPVSPVDAPLCLSDTGSAQDCTFERGGNVHPDELLIEGERDAMRGREGVEHVDFTDVLCPGEPCPVVVPPGLIVYRDTNHLTATYAATLWRVVGDRLDDEPA